MKRGDARAEPRSGFTLIEVLVSLAVLALLVSLLGSILNQSTATWRSATNKIEAFQGARAAFDTLTRQLSQATLNTYWDYNDPNNPASYRRKSELHFLAGPDLIGDSQAVFFQAPGGKTNLSQYGGLEGLLNASGFFVKYAEDQVPPLPGLSSKKRYRLMQWTQDTQKLSVYQNTADTAWLADADAEAIPIADNIIALIVWPKPPEGDIASANPVPSYHYDSRLGATASPQSPTAHQLPPIVQVTLVCIDALSADRLDEAGQSESFVRAALEGLFKDPLKFADDQKTLEGRLQNPSALGFPQLGKGIDYRIFTSAVPMREAKWSKD